MRAHPSAWLVAAVCRTIGIKVVQEVNGPLNDIYIAYPTAIWIKFLLDRLMQWQYRWAAGLIAVTPGLSDWLTALTLSKIPIIVIPNGANVRLFSPEAKNAIQLPEDFVVFVGAEAPWHDVPLILEAIALPQWPRTTSLVFVGPCSENSAARLAAAKDPRIRLIGRTPYPDVAGIVAKSRAALIIIADLEARGATGVCPIKMFEAMACGVPVIATALPYQAEFIRESGAGIVFPAGDAEGLALAVAGLTNDRKRAAEMGTRARNAIRIGHSWDARSKITSDFLHSFLQSRML